MFWPCVRGKIYLVTFDFITVWVFYPNSENSEFGKAECTVLLQNFRYWETEIQKFWRGT